MLTPSRALGTQGKYKQIEAPPFPHPLPARQQYIRPNQTSIDFAQLRFNGVVMGRSEMMCPCTNLLGLPGPQYDLYQKPNVPALKHPCNYASHICIL